MLRTLSPRLPRALAARSLAIPASTRAFSRSLAARKQDDSNKVDVSSQYQHLQTQPTTGKDGSSASDLARRLSQDRKSVV